MSPNYLTTVCVLVLSFSLLTGCLLDRHVYESTLDRPTTVTVVDQQNNAPLFTKAIPVGHALAINIDSGYNSRKPPKSMHWSLYKTGSMPKSNQYTLIRPYESDTITLGVAVRIDVSYRPADLEAALEAEALPMVDIAPMVGQAAEAVVPQPSAATQPAEADHAHSEGDGGEVIDDVEAMIQAPQEPAATQPEAQLLK